jgi:coronatine-insensitive protein 1
LKVLSLEESDVIDEGGEWLHALAQHNSVLESLDFAVLGLDSVSVEDLALLAGRCKSLVSLKVSDIDMSELDGVWSKVPFLKELGTGSCNDLGDEKKGMAVSINLPQHLTSLSGLWAMLDVGLQMVKPVAANLKKLDLKFTLLSSRGHCELLSHCFALEDLQVLNVLGDEGLKVLGKTCKELRRLRVEDDDAGYISHSGVVAIAQGCAKLRYLALYVCDITNAALAMVGQGCLHLTDCRIVLGERVKNFADLPLDDGVKLLLKGCVNLTRFCLYLRQGALTDQGLAHIGEYGRNLKWLLLGTTGESDMGLASLAYGCQQLERLEVRDCPFGEAGFATAVVAISSLKYLWVQGHHRISETGVQLLALSRPFLHIEVYPDAQGQPGQLLAYYALTEPRTDGPPGMKVLVSNPHNHQQDILPCIL